MSEDLSQTITELSETFDQERFAEATVIKAVLQGMMVTQANLSTGAGLRSLVKIAKVEQHTDEHGAYLPYYTIITQAGHRIRVTLEVEQ